MNEIIFHVTSSMMAGHFLAGLAVLIISLIEYGMSDDGNECGEFDKLNINGKLSICAIVVLGGYYSLWNFFKCFIEMEK